METGRVRYALLCNDDGGIIDDLVVCKLDDERYFLVVNAANREKDFSWIHPRVGEGAKATDVSDRYAQIALQGPAAPLILSRLAESSSIPSKYYTLVENGRVAGIPCIVSKTGYTGEQGYELYCAPSDAVSLWEALLKTGTDEGLRPCGLGSRDTLRLEASMPLYGHEMDETVTPFEASLSGAVKLDKKDFIGKSSLAAKQSSERVRVGVVVIGHGIARGGEAVLRDGKEAGRTTSGTWCPTLQGAFAMAIVNREDSAPGTPLEIIVRGKSVAACVTPLPFYSRKKKEGNA